MKRVQYVQGIIGKEDAMERRSEINVTPYIDILLVLLIIFMVITPFTSRGIDVRLPQDLPGPDPPPGRLSSIVVEIASDGSLRVNGQPVMPQDLEAAVRDRLARAPAEIFVGAARGVFYGDVVWVVDRIRGLGVKMVALLVRS